MRYRVRIDLSFDNQDDAQAVMASAKNLCQKAVRLNEGEVNEEISFCELEICRHDEGLPCERLERVELKNL